MPGPRPRSPRDRAVAPVVVAVVGLLLLVGLLFLAAMLILANWYTGVRTDHMWPMPLVGFGALLFWVVVAVVVLSLLVRDEDRADDETSGAAGDPAVEELRRAYARGDLTDEEYESRRERLEGDR